MTPTERTARYPNRDRSTVMRGSPNGPARSQVIARALSPFWLFQDASRGDQMMRAAAYRHNRRMCVTLPRYLMKWLIGSAFAWLLVNAFGALAPLDGGVNIFVLMAAACGIVFAYAICVMAVTLSAYLYLRQHEQ